jgi:membrane glycosyltransferase
MFPTWPRFNVELMMALFWFSMVILLVPKFLGLLRALLSGPLRRGGGGVIGLCASFLLEIVLSALYAPVMMLSQSRHVFEILMGRDSGWNPQRRDDGGTGWREAWRYHLRDTLIAVVTGVILWFLSPPLLAWVSPALLGLLLSIPLSRASGSRTLGGALSKLGFLRIPVEVDVPALVRRRAALIAEARALPEDGLRYLARNREARLVQIEGNLPRPPDPPGHPDPNAFTARQKLLDAHSLEQALEWLTRVERIEVASSEQLLNHLSLLPDAQRSLI